MALWLLTGVLILLLAGLIMGVARPAILFLLAALSMYFTGLASLEDTLSHYTNPGLITLILLLLCAVALEKTPLLSYLEKLISHKIFSVTLLKLSISTAVLSSFTNNTAVVAALLRVLRRQQEHPAAKLLLPLSYAAILGGTLTLIGSSTNMMVNTFVVEADLKPLGFFEFSLVGLCVVLACSFLMLFLAPMIKNRISDESDERTYLLEAVVKEGSKLIGNSITDNDMRSLNSLYLTELDRNGVCIRPVPPSMKLRAGDTLRFSGDQKGFERLQQFDGLDWFGKSEASGENLVEGVVGASSYLVGKTLKVSGFRERNDAAVVALHRGNLKQQGSLGEIELMPGDVLMMTPGPTFNKRIQESDDFAAVSGVDIHAQLSKGRSVFVLLSFLGAIASSVFALLPLVKALAILLMIYCFSGVLTLNDLRRRFPVELMVIIGSALSLASLMVTTGLAQQIVATILPIFSGSGVFGALVGVYLLTLILTEVVTNNAAAALSFPIAYSLALEFGVDIRPFIMAVIFGASASFISPYGYQTHLMVFHAGEYRFSDYIKMGLPLSLCYSAIVLWVIPILFPF